MANKRTNREWFELIAACGEVQAIKGANEWIDHQIELLDKKKASGRSNPNAKEYETLTADILAFMVRGEKYRVSDVMAGVAVPDGLTASTSLFSARLNDLVKVGTVGKETVKGKVMFFLQ